MSLMGHYRFANGFFKIAKVVRKIPNEFGT